MAALSDNTKGALLMMCSMAAFTFNDACMKLLGVEVPLFQTLFLRGLASTVLVYALARAMAAPIDFRLSRRDWTLVALRTFAEAAAAFFFITALLNMPLANATAILQMLPLTVTLGGALFLGEPIGWRRMAAIAVGFVGMLLIIRPGPNGFDLFAIYALIAVVFVTVRDLCTRSMSSAVSSMTVTFAAALGVTVFAGVSSLSVTWVPLNGGQFLLLAGASVFVLGGYFFSVLVMRVGDVSFTSPFRYSSLIWSLMLGLVVFGDWPDMITLVGSVIVVGTGVFTLLRGRRLAQTA